MYEGEVKLIICAGKTPQRKYGNEGRLYCTSETRMVGIYCIVLKSVTFVGNVYLIYFILHKCFSKARILQNVL